MRTESGWKVANVRYWSRILAIEVYLSFEHAVFVFKKVVLFPHSTAKLIGDFF